MLEQVGLIGCGMCIGGFKILQGEHFIHHYSESQPLGKVSHTMSNIKSCGTYLS